MKTLLAISILFFGFAASAEVNMEDPNLVISNGGSAAPLQATFNNNYAPLAATVAAEPFMKDCDCNKVSSTPSNLLKDEQPSQSADGTGSADSATGEQ